jgi:hypothetical protein
LVGGSFPTQLEKPEACRSLSISLTSNNGLLVADDGAIVSFSSISQKSRLSDDYLWGGAKTGKRDGQLK